MEKIKVKANKGRVAYTHYVNGHLISEDEPRIVNKTPWIQKLLKEDDIVEVKDNGA